MPLFYASWIGVHFSYCVHSPFHCQSVLFPALSVIVQYVKRWMTEPLHQRCNLAQTLLPAEVKAAYRNLLVDWLVEVHQQFSMLQETLFLGVALLDRFLQVRNGLSFLLFGPN